MLTDLVFGDNRCVTRPARTSGIPAGKNNGPRVNPSGERADGIDCYAEIPRHEAYHNFERHKWWPEKDPERARHDNPLKYATIDSDFDKVPNAVEDKYLALGRNCSWKDKKSCTGRPTIGGIVTQDLEMNAYRVGWATWDPTTGRADDEDWGVWRHNGRCTVHPKPARNMWKDPSRCPE